ncbi:hypothetical protein L7F22_063572 [Adiantum nelumboides]|nr:hypothetical protein [Adiantum nelumboides]
MRTWKATLGMGDEVEMELEAKLEMIYDAASDKATEMIMKNRHVLDALLEHVLEFDAISKEDIARLMKEHGAIYESEPFVLFPIVDKVEEDSRGQSAKHLMRDEALSTILLVRFKKLWATPFCKQWFKAKFNNFKILQNDQQERVLDRPLNETSKKGASLGNEEEMHKEPPHQSVIEGVAHQELFKDRDGSETLVTFESDATPRRRRAKQSPSPVKKKRSSSTPSHANYKKGEDKSRRRKQRKKSLSSSSYSSQPSSYYESSNSSSRKPRGEASEEAMRHGRDQRSSRNSKRGERTSLSLPMMEPLEQLTKCWLSSNNLIRHLGMKNSLNLQSYKMFLCTFKNQPIMVGRPLCSRRSSKNLEGHEDYHHEAISLK